MYIVIYTHLDISFTLNWLSQYFNDYAEHYKHALKRLLQYIYSTINLEIMYESSESQNLIEYSDSNYTLNKQNWKLVLDYVYMFKKQSEVEVSDNINYWDWIHNHVYVHKDRSLTHLNF